MALVEVKNRAFVRGIQAMISLADWEKAGAPGILTLRESKGKGRLKLIFVERKGAGYDVRRFYYEYPQQPIVREWYANLEQIGEPMTRMGQVRESKDR